MTKMRKLTAVRSYGHFVGANHLCVEETSGTSQEKMSTKTVHEAHVAAEVIAGELQGNKELAAAAFNARVIPSVAYTDPEVAWVGLTEDQAKAPRHQGQKGPVPLDSLRPRHCQWPRRRPDQTPV